MTALSGIIDSFRYSHLDAIPTGSECAGLWLQDIFHGLLWTTHDSSQTSRETEYLAPSWSWAAVIGLVHWPSRTIERHQQDNTVSEFLDIEIGTAGGGRATSGCLLIRAAVQGPVEIVPPVDSVPLRFPLDVIYEGKAIGNCAYDVDDDDGGSNGDSLYLVQIRRQEPLDSNYPYHPTALLVRKSEAMEYQRVGCATLDEDYLGFFEDSIPTTVALV